MKNSKNILDTLDNLQKKAVAKGADSCDVVHINSTSISVAQRLGKQEKLERSEGVDLGLRVVLGKSQAIVSSSDISPEAFHHPDRFSMRMIQMQFSFLL